MILLISFDDKLKDLNKEVTLNKTRHIEVNENCLGQKSVSFFIKM